MADEKWDDTVFETTEGGQCHHELIKLESILCFEHCSVLAVPRDTKFHQMQISAGDSKVHCPEAIED